MLSVRSEVRWVCDVIGVLFNAQKTLVNLPEQNYFIWRSLRPGSSSFNCFVSCFSLRSKKCPVSLWIRIMDAIVVMRDFDVSVRNKLFPILPSSSSQVGISSDIIFVKEQESFIEFAYVPIDQRQKLFPALLKSSNESKTIHYHMDIYYLCSYKRTNLGDILSIKYCLKLASV